MPAKRRILPLAISSLLFVPLAKAAPVWECQAGSDGNWVCYKDGVLVAPEPPAGAPAVAKPAAQPAPASSPASPREEAATGSEAAAAPRIKALEEPSQPEVTSTLESPEPDDSREEPAAQATRTEAETTTRQVEAAQESTPTSEPSVRPEEQPEAISKAVVETQPESEPEAEPLAEQPAQQSEPQPESRSEPRSEQAQQQETAATPVTEAEPESLSGQNPPEPAITDESAIDGPVPAAHAANLQVARIDRDLNWQQCDVRLPLTTEAPQAPGEDRTYISADGAELQRDSQLASFRGAVVLEDGNKRVEADAVDYDRNSDNLSASGNVFFEQPGLRVGSQQAELNLAQETGQLKNVEYRLLDRSARGSAEQVEILDRNRSRYQQLTYTSCQPGNSDWVLNAREMEIDRESGTGIARDASLRFKGVPLFYTPYISFPIDDRRKSGFLVPSIGYSDSRGVELAAPYYFNIAPNLDATMTPRVLSRRGLMLGGELRYLQPTHRGEIKGEVLASDSQRTSSQNSLRGALSIDAIGDPAPNWRFEVDASYVSDNNYLDDIGDSLAISSARQLERRADIRYLGNGWDFLGRVQHYQTIDSAIAPTSRPYARLPQFVLNLDRENPRYGFGYDLRAEYVHFDRSTGVTGERVDINPGISLPMRRDWGYLTPRLSGRYTAYRLDNVTAGSDDSPSRATGSFSIDSGLFFERRGNWFGNAVTQTLEPRLFYLLTSKEGQSDLPVFDSADLDFSFDTLFRDNRFSGADRMGDANQLTAAITSRTLSDANGEELFRASLGQIYYFRDREIQLPGSTVQNDSSSALVAEVAAKLSQNWRARAGVQWNPNGGNSKTEKSSFSVAYRDQQKRIFNLGYRFTDGLIEQTDVSGKLPLGSQVSAVARWNYSLRDDQTQEAFAGLEFESCCYATRLVVREHRTSATDPVDTAVFLQLELKGLTSLGDSIDRFLEQGILGYEAD